MQRRILAIADDLTGALETGAKFAGHGLAARVTTQTTPGDYATVPVLVIDTETRHLTETQAGAAVRAAAEAFSGFAPWLIYKKTDSTLRGNIAAELRALIELFPDRPLIYAPAYPEMGRTVKGGKLFVWGVPVHQTAFAGDPFHPVREHDILKVLDGIPARVVDGESSADIQEAARMVIEAEIPLLAAGPAALAEALANCLASNGKATVYPQRFSKCLVVNGSLHPASVEQIAFAQSHGCFESGWRYFDEEIEFSGRERALQVGEQVGRLMASSPVDALIVFGGDTAFGIHRALGAPVFEPYGEIVPGVPLSRCGGVHWITKAGGFGPPDILCDIQRRLT